MGLTALRNGQNADAQGLSFPIFLLAPGECVVLCNEEERAILPSSIALESDVRCFFRTIFSGSESNYIVDDWLKRRAILASKSVELEEIIAIV